MTNGKKPHCNSEASRVFGDVLRMLDVIDICWVPTLCAGHYADVCVVQRGRNLVSRSTDTVTL